MTALTFRKQIYIVLIISILFRFGFLLFGDILPVMWDARRYVGASIGLISYIDDSGDVPFQTPLQDRVRFKHYTDKYIQGEQIEWLKYKPFSLTEARNEIFIGGPLYPFFCGVLIYLSPIADFTLLRVMNIFLDILATLMLMLIGVRLLGKKEALIAGLLYSLYFPFTLLTSMMLLESSTTLLILLSIYYLLKGDDEKKNTCFVIAGFTTGLLLLNKPTALLLIFPFMLSYLWFSKEKIMSKLMLHRAIKFLIPFVLIGICWTSIASYKYGEMTMRDPSYKEANLRQSSNITFEGYDLDKVENDFWNYSISEHISNDKVGYLGLLMKKFERMWSHTANDFKKSYVLSPGGWEIVHLILVGSGLFGLLLLTIKKSKVAVWILSLVLYYTGIHVIFHSVSRYSFNVLPLLFLASSYFIVQVYGLVKSKNVQKQNLLYALCGVIFIAFWKVTYLNSIFQLQLTEIYVWVSYVIIFAICFYLLYLISKSFLQNESIQRKLVLPVVSIILFFCCFYSTVLSRNEWSEFSCKISDSSMKAGSRIYIDNADIADKTGLIAVVIDVNSGANRKNSFTVSIGDSLSEYVGGQPPLSDLFYPKPTYKFYSKYIPLGLEQFRQYAIIPVEYDQVQKLLTEKGYIDISIAINDRFQEKNNFINVYGNFETKEEEHYIPGIRFTSVERHVHKGDPRIRYSVKYLSKKVISYYISRETVNVAISTDLSPSAGLQSGRYNIFLVHFFPNGEFKVY